MKSFNLSKGKRLEQQIKSRLYSTSMINQDDYDLEEYKQEEEKLERLVEPIKSSNLSPLEKFIAVYNIVKKFKKYKEKEKLDSKEAKKEAKEVLEKYKDILVGYSEIKKNKRSFKLMEYQNINGLNLIFLSNKDLSTNLEIEK